MTTACIIPARGGSKGLPGKNIRPFMGKPLLAWSIQRARQCSEIDGGVWVSTDDKDIADTALLFGAKVVWRPAELSTDTAPSEAALIHAIQSIDLEVARPVQTIVFLQATSPLRLPDDVGQALGLFQAQGLDSLFSAAILEDATLWVQRGDHLESTSYDWRNRGMRQDHDPQLLENGSIYICRRQLLMETHNRLGGKIGIYRMPQWQSFEIDSLEDFELCEILARHKGLFWRRVDGPPNIAAVVFDFDGIFTDNAVYLDETGREMVRCDRSDGLGLERLKKACPDIALSILSGESNLIVQARAAKLGLPVAQGIGNKAEYLREFCARHGWSPAEVAYVGNDLNDLECMRWVGLSIAPADAVPAVLCEADYVLEHAGGHGGLREVCELLIAWFRDSRPS